MQIGCFRYEWQKNTIRNTLSPFSRANHWKKYHLKIAHIAINGNYYSYINQAIWYAISYSFILSPKQQQKRKLCWSHSIIRIQIKKTQFRTYLPLLHYVFISRTCNSVRIFHAFTTYPSREPAIPYVFSPRDIMRSSSLNPLYNSWNRNFLPLFSTQNYKLIDLKGSYSLPFCRWKEYRIRSFTERPLIFSRASL